MGRSKRWQKRTPHGRQFLFLVLAGPALLAGCSGGGVRDSVTQALEESTSSVATARLAAELDASGKLSTAATSTALDDALKELGKARTIVVGLSTTVQKDRELRDEALAVMDNCVSAVAAAAEAVSSQDGRPSLSEGGGLMESAAARLSALQERLGSK